MRRDHLRKVFCLLIDTTFICVFSEDDTQKLIICAGAVKEMSAAERGNSRILQS